MCYRPDGYDRNLVHAIESVVIEWTHQVRDVLKKDSSQPILDGLNPTPFEEIEFWKQKALNLECIYDQLREPKVRRMAELLEKTESSYFQVFKDMFRDVVAGKNYVDRNDQRHHQPDATVLHNYNQHTCTYMFILVIC